MAKIKSITRRKITTEKLYNLEVENDNSFIANGVVVHNCDSYIIPILKGNLGDREITGLNPSNDKLKEQIQFSDRCVDHCCEKTFSSIKL